MFTNGTTMGQKYDICGNVFANVTWDTWDKMQNRDYHMCQKCGKNRTNVYQCDTGNQLDEEATEPDEKSKMMVMMMIMVMMINKIMEIVTSRR